MNDFYLKVDDIRDNLIRRKFQEIDRRLGQINGRQQQFSLRLRAIERRIDYLEDKKDM